MKTLILLMCIVPQLLLASELPELGGEPARVERRLSDGDLAKQAAFLALLAADYGQTRSIRNFCDGRINCTVHETNPLLGKYPSDARARNYFIGAALAHVAITHFISPEHRSAWLNGSIAFEAIVVARNARLGLRIKF
jgi:hypothetical protein